MARVGGVGAGVQPEPGVRCPVTREGTPEKTCSLSIGLAKLAEREPQAHAAFLSPAQAACSVKQTREGCGQLLNKPVSSPHLATVHEVKKKKQGRKIKGQT